MHYDVLIFVNGKMNIENKPSSRRLSGFWLLLSLAAFYCVVSRSMSLGPAARDCRVAVSADVAFVIYCAGRDGIPFDTIPLACVC